MKKFTRLASIALCLTLAVFALVACGKKEYTITWKNEDGTVLTTTTVEKDAMPAYEGTPTKAEDADNMYTFKEWTPAVVKATEDATYTAKYTTVAKVAHDVTGPTAAITNGTIVADVEEAKKGATVTLTVAATTANYRVKTVTVMQGTTAVTVTGTGITRTFVMPDADVTYTAEFEEIPSDVTAKNVTIKSGIEHGSVTAAPTTAKEGATVALTVEPANGYQVKSVSVMQGTTAITVVEGRTATEYVFIMPGDAVEATAVFEEIPDVAMTMANIGVYQHVTAGQADVVAAGDITTGTDGVITIKADKAATNLVIDVKAFFAANEILSEGFSFTRSDVTEGEPAAPKALHAYKWIRTDAGDARIYVKYGDDETDPANEHVDVTDSPTALLPQDLYGEIHTPVGDDKTDTVISALYIKPLGDDTTTEGVTEEGFARNTTINFVFTAENGAEYTLKIKVENK